jgi:ATP-dependent DNA ligase
LTVPQFKPANPILRADVFTHDDYIFELKMDGFRALGLTLANTKHVRRRYSDPGCGGRPQFYELLRRRGRGEPVFYVFDLLWLDGEDLRDRPLIERKSLLRSIVPARPSILLYADRIEREGVQFFRLTCERRDLEGIVAKVKHGSYGQGWFKIRNPGYSQREGRRELFESKRAARG